MNTNTDLKIEIMVIFINCFIKVMFILFVYYGFGITVCNDDCFIRLLHLLYFFHCYFCAIGFIMTISIKVDLFIFNYLIISTVIYTNILVYLLYLP